ncbi:MAG: hypothetical protein ACWGMZ_08515 [Thermoguttaceae bacterium]
MNPDVIVDLVSMEDAEDSSSERVLADWRMLSDVEAIKRHRVYAFDRDYAVPGPRFLQFVEELARLLHPEIQLNGT